ncbi:protein of unknown function [Cupriavidus taiwanensis]|uniref:Uncharacterized protein n=1 Tax=Cupriavidus taiwanensis TaxID=164546 RepID=A0A375IAC4_9BURK|nr:protein of unknown function [Cupriavidus taiwanensis]
MQSRRGRRDLYACRRRGMPSVSSRLFHPNNNPLALYLYLQRLSNGKARSLQPNTPQLNPRDRSQTSEVIATARYNWKVSSACLDSPNGCDRGTSLHVGS